MYSNAVSPEPAQAVRLATSMSRSLSERTSMTMPPSVVPWPAPEWPPLRTASSSPSSRANAMTRATSSSISDLRDGRGVPVDGTEDDRARLVVLGIAGQDESAPELVAEPGQGRVLVGGGCRHRCFPPWACGHRG